jgi:hypothetical protein
MNTLKWATLAEMKAPRVANGTCQYYSGFVYAIGGNEKDVCERYDVHNDVWEVVPSYAEISTIKELGSWCMALA